MTCLGCRLRQKFGFRSGASKSACLDAVFDAESEHIIGKAPRALSTKLQSFFRRHMFLPLFWSLTVFSNSLTEERSSEDRASIFLVAIKCSIEWGNKQPDLFSTPSLHAMHLTSHGKHQCHPSHVLR